MAAVPAGLATALQDRYRLDRELGQGGMATVYLAEDIKHHRKVALKVLRPELAATMGPERFAREIEVAARLQHPHILGLLDSGDADGFFYYVMPYVEGETLRDRLTRGGELPVHEAVRLMAEIAEALAVAHRAGVVHRDIKPENILLSGRHALVMDFGVAKAVTEASGRQQLTTAGVALGTPAYMAPEQATADPHLDGRVDVYALGVVGYEMLTGHPPFHGLSPQQTLAAHVTQAPAPVGQWRPGLSPALESVVMECLEKRPADRFQTADELVAALEPLATPSGGMTPTTTRPLAGVAPPRKFPRWAAWLAGGALVAAAALALSLRQRPGVMLVLGKRTAVAVGPELDVWPTLAPDGRTVAYTRYDGRTAGIAVQQVDGGAPVIVTAQLHGNYCFQALSPDGSRLLFSECAGGGLYVMPTLGGQARQVVTGPVLWGSWSPDGSRIAFSMFPANSLFVQQLDTPGRTVLATGTQLHSPSWSRDGKSIAYVEGNPSFHTQGNNASSAIKLVRTAGGAPVAVTDSGSLNTSPVWIPGHRALLFISDREGGRDIYQQTLKQSGAPNGPPIRLTTGLNPERLSFSADGKRLAWSVFTQTSNVWSIPIPARDSVPLSRATAVTSGSQSIEEIAASPDGVWLYYDSDRSGHGNIWRIPLKGGQPEQLTTDPAGDFAPSISPDGKEIAFHSLRNGSNNRDIFVMPAGGGAARQVSTSLGDDRLPAWSPDGHALAWADQYNTRDSGILVARRRDDGTWAEPTRYSTSGGGGVPVWTPDGRAVSYFNGRGLQRLDVATGETTLLSGSRGVAYFAWAGNGRTVYGVRSDSLGRTILFSLDLPGGKPRTLAYADHPLMQEYRYGFALSGRRMYVPLVDFKADVWVAEASVR